MNNIRTRFAPSPTGALHIGGLRTAVYAYTLAKHSGGDFILRIEDTDQKREVAGTTEKIKENLKLFGLGWDEYYVQSERAKEGIYKKAAEQLVADGHAFYCSCKPKNAKEEGFSKELRDPCRNKKLTSGAIKLKVPDGETVSYTDFVLGKEISWETSSVADTTLLKSDGFPTYHLAVVVDDTDMKITHCLRGHDWLPSTPIHLLVYKYLGITPIEIGHLTDIQDPEGGKLSKRKGSVSCEALLFEGYLPEALLNFIILLGWAPKDNRELYTLEEFVKAFDEAGFQKTNPVFNRVKLDWFNGEYIRQKSDEELFEVLRPFIKDEWDIDKVKRMIPLTRERMNKLTDFENLAGFIFEEKKPFQEIVNEAHLVSAYESLEKAEEWVKPTIDTVLMRTVSDNKYKTGDFFMDLRGTISGSRVTPPINDSLVVLGKEETLKRLKKALGK
jgi:glutamyl-tRNA synthetase